MIIEKYPKSASNAFGFVFLKPDDYSSAVAYPSMLFMHGAAGQGDGSSAGLDNVANQQVPEQLKKAIDKFKIVVIAPQYERPGNNAVMDHALSWLSANVMIDPNRKMGSGFSMGGGEITRYISSSLQNADQFSCVISIAGLNGIKDAKCIVQSSLPVLFFHAKNDSQASITNSQNAIKTINDLNPSIPAKGVFYNEGDHWIYDRVLNVEQYPWMGNEIPDTVWAYALSLTKDKPAVVPVADGMVKPVAVADDFTTNTDKIKLIGNRSRNCIASKSKWDKVSWPDGVNQYAVGGCGYIDCDNITLPKEGKYVFRLTVADATGQTSTKDITVTYSKGTIPTDPVKKIVKSINLIGYWLTFTDGSKAQAISAVQDIETGKITYKISDTEQYTI